MNHDTKLATILLVDDEPSVTEALKRSLRREPYEFLTATSAAQAQELLLQRPIDVIISDEQMPGMSGSELLGWVRKRHPHTIRMILSGQASLAAAVRAINEGEVHRFFLKPCNPADLICTVGQALAHRQLEERSRRLLREYQRQASMLARVELENPGLLHLEIDDQGAVVVDETESEHTLSDLLREMEQTIRSD